MVQYHRTAVALWLIPLKLCFPNSYISLFRNHHVSCTEHNEIATLLTIQVEHVWTCWNLMSTVNINLNNSSCPTKWTWNFPLLQECCVVLKALGGLKEWGRTPIIQFSFSWFLCDFTLHRTVHRHCSQFSGSTALLCAACCGELYAPMLQQHPCPYACVLQLLRCYCCPQYGTN